MVSLSFVSIPLIALLLFYFGTGKRTRILVISVLWLIFSGTLAYTGFFRDVSSVPPPFALIFFGAVIISIVLYRAAGSQTDTRFLLAIHILRIPVELALFRLFLDKKIPQIMTYEGWNYDVISGITALLLLGFILISRRYPPHWLMLGWNFMGLILLLTIVTLSVLSSPLPFQLFGFEQPNIAVVEFPVIFLPAFIVPVVFVSHLLMIRAQFSKSVS
jgi:hypothetical protein